MIKQSIAIVIFSVIAAPSLLAEELKTPFSKKFITSSETAIKNYERYFETLDIDRSGRITRDELALASERKHAKFDLNGDGYVSADEYASQDNNLTLSGAMARIQKVDVDQDNRISKDEARQTALKVMRFDADKSRDLIFSEIIITAPPVVQRYYDQYYAKAR